MHPLDLACQDRQRGKYRRALRKFKQYLEQNEVNSQAYLGIAWCYNALNQPEQAAIAAQRAIELDSLLADPHIILASVHLQRRNNDEFEREIQEALALDPDSAYAYYMLGIHCLLDKTQYPEAVEKLEKAIDARPEHSSFYASLASTYQKMGNHTAALKAYRNALKYSCCFEDIAKVILSFVGYYRWILVILFFFPLITRSIYSLPLVIALSGYLALNAWLGLKRGKYWWGFGSIALLLFVIYILYHVYGI